MNPSLLAAQAIVLFAFFFRSFSGFGGALLSIPLLALFFPLKFIVPVESVLEVALSLLLVPAAIRKGRPSSTCCGCLAEPFPAAFWEFTFSTPWAAGTWR